jgi:phage shock protein PspC (stress-responsive transcriptional regulator)
MSEHTFTQPALRRLERSRDDHVVAGVCGGLGRYFDITPAVFRLGFVVLTVLGGAGVLVYIAAAIVMPKEGEPRSIAEDVLAGRREHPGRLIALGLVAVAILSLLARADTWPSAGVAWPLAIIGALALVWTVRRGIATAVVALVGVLALAAAAAVAAAFLAFDVSLGDGVGNHTYTPTTSGSYALGIGKLDLDLRHVQAPARVTAKLGVGDLRIVVPRTGAAVDAHVKAGSIDAEGRHDDGTSVRVRTGSGSLTVVAHVGAGHIEVVRAQ